MYPELALTTFFPRWFVDDIAEADHCYERSMPNAATQPLFDEARRLGIGFCLGYAARSTMTGTGGTCRRSSSVTARSSPRYKKVAHPGPRAQRAGPPVPARRALLLRASPGRVRCVAAFGGRVGMMICNDRRWPETYRVMGLQGVELILCGYNTPIHYAPDPSQDILQGFHNALVHAVRRVPERHVGGRRRESNTKLNQ